MAPESALVEASCLSADDVLRRLASDRSMGLGASDAVARLEQHGANELTERAGRSRLAIVREQLLNVMTCILLAAAVLSVALGDWVEAVVILAIVVLNAILGYTQEYRAEQSMAALKRMSVPTVRVRREPASSCFDQVASSLACRVPASLRVAFSVASRPQASGLLS